MERRSCGFPCSNFHVNGNQGRCCAAVCISSILRDPKEEQRRMTAHGSSFIHFPLPRKCCVRFQPGQSPAERSTILYLCAGLFEGHQVILCLLSPRRHCPRGPGGVSCMRGTKNISNHFLCLNPFFFQAEIKSYTEMWLI